MQRGRRWGIGPAHRGSQRRPVVTIVIAFGATSQAVRSLFGIYNIVR